MAKVLTVAYYNTSNPTVDQVMLRVWHQAMINLDQPFVLVKAKNFNEALSWVQQNKADAVVGPINLIKGLPDVHFVDSYVPHEFVLATLPSKTSFWQRPLGLVRAFLGWVALWVLGILASAGLLFWFIERREKKSVVYATPFIKGWLRSMLICFGFFTTVGSFDNTMPTRPFSRIILVLLVLTSVFGMSAITSSIVSYTLSLQETTKKERVLSEFTHQKVAYLTDSADVKDILLNADTLPVDYLNIDKAMDALFSHQNSAVVTNRISLKSYLYQHQDVNIQFSLIPNDYANYYFLIHADEPIETKVIQMLQTLKLFGRINQIIDNNDNNNVGIENQPQS